MKKFWQNRNTQSILITSPTNFPSGLAIKTDSHTYWIKDNKRYRLVSDRAAQSWNFPTVNATEKALELFKMAGKLGFRDGTLIKNIADGKMYLISQNKKRHVVTPDVFQKYGLDRSSIIEVSQSECDAHELGDDL